MFKSLSLAAVAVLATLSVSQAAEPIKPMAPHPHKEGPCTPVLQACKNAGFTRGGMKEGKGIIADCVKPLEDGKAVAGVTVDKGQIDACKADYQARKAQFDEKMKNDPEFAKKMEARKAAWAAKHPDAPKPGVAAKAIEKLA